MKEETVLIFSAHQLTEDEIEEIRKKFNLKNNQIIENIIDKDLIGGLRIVCNNRIFDLSLKGRLNKLRNILYETN